MKPSHKLNEHQGLWTTLSFVFLVMFLFGSYFTSDYFNGDSVLTGNVIIDLGSYSYDTDILSTSSEVGEPADFIISLFDENSTSADNFNCSILFYCDDSNFDFESTSLECEDVNGESIAVKDMVYDNVIGSYSYLEVFDNSGSFDYEINCINQEDEITTNKINYEILELEQDFSVEDIALEKNAIVGEQVDFEIIVSTNNAYDGVEYIVNYGDEEEGFVAQAVEYNLVQGKNNLTFNHVYDTSGTYSFDFSIDPSNLVLESDENNNDISINVIVSASGTIIIDNDTLDDDNVNDTNDNETNDNGDNGDNGDEGDGNTENEFDVNLSIVKTEKDMYTKLNILINTSDETICRYDYENNTFDDMKRLSYNYELEHEKILYFYDAKTIEFHIRCINDEGYEYYTKSPQVVIRNILDVWLENLEEDENYYETKKESLEDDKGGLKEDIDNEDSESRKERLQEELDVVNIDSIYVSAMYDLSGEYRSILDDLQNKSDEVDEDYIEDIDEDISSLIGNLSSINSDINDSLENDLDKLYNYYNDKIDIYEELYEKYLEKLEYENEKKDYSNDYLIELYNYKVNKIQLDLDKYNALSDLDYDYDDNIDFLEDELVYYQDEIEIIKQEEIIDDLEIEKDSFDFKISLYEDYKNNISDLEDEIEDALDVAQSERETMVISDLEDLLEDLDSLKEALDEDVDLFEDEIDRVEDEIELAEDNEYDANDNNDDVADDNKSNSEIVKWDSSSSSSISKKLYDNTEISEFVVNLKTDNATNITSGEVLYEVLNKSEYVTGNYNIFSAFKFSLVNESQVENVTINFEKSSSELLSENISKENITLLIYSSSISDWKNVGTALTTSSGLLKYSSIITTSGVYGIGVYHESTSTYMNQTIDINDTINCIPNWECGQFSACNNGKKVKICNDTNACDVNNLTKEETESCDVKPECDDGIKNGDEEGVDCGGSCARSCEKQKVDIDLDKAGEIAEKASPGLGAIGWVILVIIAVTSVVLVSVESVMRHKNKSMFNRFKKKQKAKAEGTDKPKAYFNKKLIKLIIVELLQGKDLEEIKQNCVKLKFNVDEIVPILSVVRFIVNQVKAKMTKGRIASVLIQGGWREDDSKYIIDFVRLNMLIYQIKEYELDTSSNEDRQLVVEIFKEDGYPDDIIAQGFKVLGKSNAKKGKIKK